MSLKGIASAGLCVLALSGCASYESEMFWSQGTDSVTKPADPALSQVSFRAEIWFRNGSVLEANVPIRITNPLTEPLIVDGASITLEDDDGRKYPIRKAGILKIVPGVSQPALWVFPMPGADLSRIAYLNLRWVAQVKGEKEPVALVTRFDRRIPPPPQPLPAPSPQPVGAPEPVGPDLGAP
ncbi:MAG: hypothetical protein AAB215_08935 [Planctomycetota bacterium]